MGIGTAGLKSENSEQRVGDGAWDSCCVIICTLEGMCPEQIKPYCEETRKRKRDGSAKWTTNTSHEQKFYVSYFLLSILSAADLQGGVLDELKPLKTVRIMLSKRYCVPLCTYTLTITIR